MLHANKGAAGPLDGVVDYATDDFLGVRTEAGLFRFFGRNAFGGVVGMSAHLFADVPVTEADLKAWLDSQTTLEHRVEVRADSVLHVDFP